MYGSKKKSVEKWKSQIFLIEMCILTKHFACAKQKEKLIVSNTYIRENHMQKINGVSHCTN